MFRLLVVAFPSFGTSYLLVPVSLLFTYLGLVCHGTSSHGIIASIPICHRRIIRVSEYNTYSSCVANLASLSLSIEQRRTKMGTITDGNPAPPPGNRRPPFLIGISGCSSSGKTTLALALSVIFGDVLRPTAGDSANSIVSIISQDDYFLPKAQCSSTSFTPRLPADEVVVAGRIEADGTVEAAGADCLAAAERAALVGAVEAFLLQVRSPGRDGAARRHGSPSRDARVSPEPPYHAGPGRQPANSHGGAAVRARAAEQAALNADVPGGFEGLFFGVGARSGLPEVRRRMGVVEGFLLFARGEQQELDEASSNLQRAILRRCVHAALFLRIDKATAVRRRFRRGCYADAPRGGRRPGQMWKTRGYFEEVGWA